MVVARRLAPVRAVGLLGACNGGGDLDAMFAALGLPQAVLLGNSLGGVNAYQYAARAPERVRAMIVEDIGVVLQDDLRFVLAWRGTFTTRQALEAAVGPRFVAYLSPSFRQTPAGWRLVFDPDDMYASQHALNGDHWTDWLATSCPALVVRGRDSRVTTHEHLHEMATRRPNTELVTLAAGHVAHHEVPEEFERVVRAFLSKL